VSAGLTLTDEERRALIDLVTTEIDKQSRSPLSPRTELLKRIREKLVNEDDQRRPRSSKEPT
jgi:hypothetical protein